MRLLTASIVTATLVMAGCTTNPQTGQKTVSKAAIGAIGCGLLGAGVAYSNADKDKMGRGAAIGATVCGAAGAYMDRQAKKMQEQMAGTGVDVNYDQATGALKLVMPGNITFATADATVTQAFKPTLDKVASTLVEFKDTTITVSGHTDNVGNAAYNQGLSERRAGAVAQYLTTGGVSASRISTVGYGMNRPVADNGSDAGRSQNRRVEITINPTAQAGS